MEYRLTIIMFHLLFLAVDLAIHVNVYRNKDNSTEYKLFNKFTISVMFQQVFSLLAMTVSKEAWNPGNAVHYLIMGLLFISMTGCSYYWYLYLKKVIFGAREINLAVWTATAFPLLVMIVCCIASPFTHWVFYIDQNGEYQRGSMFLLQVTCPYIYVIIAIILAIFFIDKKDSDRVKKTVRMFLSYIFPSTTCVLIQIFVVQGGFTSIGISIGFILMYLELYLEDVNEVKRLKSVDALNKELQEVNEAQETQLEEIIALNSQLEENQTQLEESVSEQEAQLEEITSLNKQLDDNYLELERQFAVVNATAQRYFCIYTVNLETQRFHEIKALPNMHAALGSEGDSIPALKLICEKMVIPEDKEAMVSFNDISRWKEYLSNKDSHSCEYRGITSGWSKATIFAAGRDEDGTVNRVVYANELIHEQKNVELELENANNAKTKFLFNMSHDIRTPMNAIIGFRDLLEKYQDNPEKRTDYLRKIEDSSNVLLSIINNVLEMARIERGTVLIEEVAWSTEQFNDTLYSIFQEMMLQKGITFTRSVKVNNHYVFCDPIKLREVFFNILSNAYKYTNPGGRINMELMELPSDKEGYAVFRTTITDTGIGMSEEFLPHLFEEFTRENNTTDAKVEGTGLGMPIVKRLIELMGGTIEVKSKKGEGTTFIITLSHKIAEKSNLVEHSDSTVNPEDFAGKRVLLAEDNELNSEIMVEILSEQGFLVECAENGAVAVDMLMAKPVGYYDLILMDIQMPIMNGYEATRAIRALEDKNKASISIIAMTANAFEEDKRAAINAGMNEHLAKPIDVQELMRTLARMLKSNKG